MKLRDLANRLHVAAAALLRRIVTASSALTGLTLRRRRRRAPSATGNIRAGVPVEAWDAPRIEDIETSHLHIDLQRLPTATSQSKTPNA